ncbi:MAG: hypothetical protein ACF8PN_06635 [Phycisphaerales bacterium]
MSKIGMLNGEGRRYALAMVATGFIAGTAAAQVVSVRSEVDSSRSFTPLQSYTMAESHDGLLFFCGLKSMGRHDLARDGRESFPGEHFNRSVHLFDLDTKTTLSGSIEHFSATMLETLTVTNPQSVQYGDTLYIYGGYGPVSDSRGWATRDTVTTVDLAAVRDAIVQQQPIPESAFVSQTAPLAQVAGGRILKLGGYHLLVGGAGFIGNYADIDNFVTQYSERIHLFDPNRSFIDPVRTWVDPEYHRRDGNVTPITIGPYGDQRPGFLFHGGVFKPGNEFQPEAWEHPLTFDSGDMTVTVDRSFEQMMNQYEGARVSFHSESKGENYIITMGGLSASRWDGSQFVPDFAIPWVIDASMITTRDGRAVDERIVGAAINPVTNTEFVPNAALPTNSIGQILWDELPPGETLLGHYYGGIEARSPGSSAITEASSRVYAVYGTIDKIELEATPIVAGQDAVFTLTNADPDAGLTFAYSVDGPGPRFVPALQLSIDLTPPVRVFARRRADANGEATVTMRVPSNAPAREIWIQAVMEEGRGFEKSNLIADTIQN